MFIVKATMYVNDITTLVIPIIKQLVNFTTILVTKYLVVKFTRCFIKFIRCK